MRLAHGEVQAKATQLRKNSVDAGVAGASFLFLLFR